MSQNASKEQIFYHSFYHHGVDEKRRVQVPSKWRSAEGDAQLTLILWPKGAQQEACLLVLPPELFSSMVAKITALPFSDTKAEALRHIVGRKSDRVALDKGGRICIPEYMAKAVGIQSEAVLVGLLDRFEIWNPQRYETAYAVDVQISVEAIKEYL